DSHAQPRRALGDQPPCQQHHADEAADAGAEHQEHKRQAASEPVQPEPPASRHTPAPRSSCCGSMLIGSRHPVRHRSFKPENWNAPAPANVAARISRELSSSHGQRCTTACTPKTAARPASPSPSHTARDHTPSTVRVRRGCGTREVTAATSRLVGTVVGSIIAPTITVQVNKNAPTPATDGSALYPSP